MNKLQPLPFRHVHLDFHTSPDIPGVGGAFDKARFQQMLALGHVDSIALFSKCHHGYSYHPTEVGIMHPHLRFDLLGAQMAACAEIGVRTSVYLSAGIDEYNAMLHPEWLMRNADESTVGSPDFVRRPGYHLICLNTGYQDVLLAQTREVMDRYAPRVLFFDFSGVYPCHCAACRAAIRARGRGIRDDEAVMEQAEATHARFVDELNALLGAYPERPRVFHNCGHIRKGRRDLLARNSHLEIESLPTGGWGYDHFILSAAYAATLGMPYNSTTGRFHTMWGDFGGYKHPNALRYECGLALAMGAHCSVGTQLHPDGQADEVCFSLIGAAFQEVGQKQAWCEDTELLADVALLSEEAMHDRYADLHTQHLSDIGAARMLQEGKYLFHIVDAEADFSRYKLIILPDSIRLDEPLYGKLRAFFDAGGRILATGESGLWADRDEFALDFGARFDGACAYQPSYIRPDFPVTNPGGAYVVHAPGYQIEPAGARVLGWREDPYFNRTVEHFCSHRQTPSARKISGAAIVMTDRTAYVSHQLFSDYAQWGYLHAREIVQQLLDALLGDQKTLLIQLPDRAVATLHAQPAQRRSVLHIAFAHTTKRGRFPDGDGMNGDIEVVESIVPLCDVPVSVKLDQPVRRVSLAPGGEPLPFSVEAGRTRFAVPKLECHQMIVLDWGEPDA